MITACSFVHSSKSPLYFPAKIRRKTIVFSKEGIGSMNGLVHEIVAIWVSCEIFSLGESLLKKILKNQRQLKMPEKENRPPKSSSSKLPTLESRYERNLCLYLFQVHICFTPKSLSSSSSPNHLVNCFKNRSDHSNTVLTRITSSGRIAFNGKMKKLIGITRC